MRAIDWALIGLVGFSVPAEAKWSGRVEISTIEISNVHSRGVWLNFTTVPYREHTCSIKNGQYKLGGGAANVRDMTTLAIWAHLNVRPVTVYWGGACSKDGYPVLLGLTLT